MSNPTLWDEIRAERRLERAEAQSAAADPSVIPAMVAVLTEDADADSRVAVLTNLKMLYGALGNEEENVYHALLSCLDRAREKSEAVRSNAIETLLTLASKQLRTDSQAIQALIGCLQTDPDERVRQWAVAGLCPAAAAGDAEAIRVLRRAALHTPDADVSRDAIEALEDLGIPVEEKPANALADFGEMFRRLMASAKRVPMRFAPTAPVRQEWSEDVVSSIYTREETSYLRIVHRTGAPGVIGLVMFTDTNQITLIKPALFRANREGILFADVSLAEREDTDQIIVDILDPGKFQESSDISLQETAHKLETAFRLASKADRAIWKQWADSLTEIPETLVAVVAQLRSVR